jgi:hypothetical protein
MGAKYGWENFHIKYQKQTGNEFQKYSNETKCILRAS